MVSRVAIRNTFPWSCFSRLLFCNTMSSAWSHGTSSNTIVSVPFTLGSSTTFKPLISWISRKKSRRSTSFRFTEIGSPVYLLGAAMGVCAPPAVAAAFPACCCAASCAGLIGRIGVSFPLNDARTTEGWVSSRGNANRGEDAESDFDACVPRTRRGAPMS